MQSAVGTRGRGDCGRRGARRAEGTEALRGKFLPDEGATEASAEARGAAHKRKVQLAHGEQGALERGHRAGAG